jgi:hypothetical protein
MVAGLLVDELIGEGFPHGSHQGMDKKEISGDAFHRALQGSCAPHRKPVADVRVSLPPAVLYTPQALGLMRALCLNLVRHKTRSASRYGHRGLRGSHQVRRAKHA